MGVPARSLPYYWRMDLIALAIPFFLLAIIIELAVNWVRGSGYFRANDAINSLSAGINAVSDGVQNQVPGNHDYREIYLFPVGLEFRITRYSEYGVGDGIYNDNFPLESGTDEIGQNIVADLAGRA